jgi:transcriptional regulator with XRE-family HTH domain
MRTSTIAKHLAAGEGTSFASVLGHEIRDRRVALGLSQAAAAWPLSRAFLSSVESGRMTPSLSSLLIIARQLNASAATILASVESQLEARNHDGDTDEEADLSR